MPGRVAFEAVVVLTAAVGSFSPAALAECLRQLPVEKLHSASLPLSHINEAFERLAQGNVIRQILLPQVA